MTLDDYLEALSETHQLSELCDILINAFDDLGANAIVGHPLAFGGSSHIEEWRPIIVTFSETVQQAYARLRATDDPFFHATLANGSPVHFQDITGKAFWSEAQWDLFKAMNREGFRDGVATTAITKPGIAAYFAVSFPEVRTDLTRADLRRIHVMFCEFYFRYRQINRIEQAVLSTRERQILTGIVSGKSNAEISEQLDISKTTVDTYVRRCFEKLNVSTRTEAALKFFSLGLQLEKAAHAPD